MAKSNVWPSGNAIDEPMRNGGRGDHTPDVIEPRSGVYAIMKRFERRVPTIYRLAHDPLAAIPRLLARMLRSVAAAGGRRLEEWFRRLTRPHAAIESGSSS